MTEDESKIVDVLITCPRTLHPWEAPILAVAQAMGWQRSHASEVVGEMVHRKLVKPVTVASPGNEPMRMEYWWEKGQDVE